MFLIALEYGVKSLTCHTKGQDSDKKVFRVLNCIKPLGFNLQKGDEN